ncbi:MAG: GTP-binding protein, partial [Sphingomonadales bacterium]
TEAEGLADLMIAETEVQRRAALSMAGGALSREVLVWREELLSVAALVEAQIDFSEESDVAAQDGGVGNRIAALASTLDRRLARPRIERLRDGIRVVLAGPPNAGKSSLLNALVDREAAIVSAEPGTTRDLIEVPVTIGGTPFLFLDTAGLREPGGDIERIGIARAEVAIAGADLILWLGDDEPPFAGEHVLRLFPRSDMQNRQAIPPGRLAVSSRTLAGLDELIWRLRETADHLLPSTSETALNRRQAEVLTMVARSLDRCADESDLILVAENLRAALLALDGLTGAAGVEDMLDRLFAGLCIGK